MGSYWWKNSLVANTPENVAAFLAYANQIALEGASDIGLALSSISSAPWAKNSADNIFLLSDGADTWGEDDSYELANKINDNDLLFAFNTGMSGTSINKLNHLTRASGGALFSVTGEDEIKKVSAAFQAKPWKIEKVEIAGTQDVLIAGRPKYIYSGQKLMLSGRGTIAKGTPVKLILSQNGTKKSISVMLNKSIKSNLTNRIYGQMATNILEEFGHTTEKNSIAYAKHFSVPGQTCSLLMLESEEDYKEYNITASEDAFVVQSTSVNKIIGQVLRDIAAVLGNAKVKFTNWLEKLAKIDGVEFEIPTALSLILDQTPESTFRINQVGLNCKSRQKSAVPKSITTALAESNLDYDLITDGANTRLKTFSKHDALKLLSSLMEKSPGNTVMARDIAYSALEWDLNEQAYYLFKRVLQSRPYEPQTYLALAKSLSKIGNKELALIYYEIAIAAKWDGRFGEFRKIAALDYLNLLNQVKSDKNFKHADYAAARFKTIKKEFKEESVDLLVTISWNTDNTDIDLHVVEPSGEECYYKHTKTRMGGYITEDVTQGYGPEMYLLKNAKSGKFKVKAKYFSSNRNRASTRTKIHATIYKNWGKPNEKVINKVITLKDNKDMHHIITVDIDENL